MTDISAVSRGDVREASRAMKEASAYWWLLLLSGAAWLLFSVIIFRFDWSSVSSISILFGCAMVGAGLTELVMVVGVAGGWKIAHGLLGLAFGVIGVIAFVHPGNTFAALAGVLSFYFVLKGTFDIVVSMASRGAELWWLQLLLGVGEILLGFWAAGDFGHKTVLLLVWVGSAALIRGISQIVAAFAIRSLRPES